MSKRTKRIIIIFVIISALISFYKKRLWTDLVVNALLQKSNTAYTLETFTPQQSTTHTICINGEPYYYDQSKKVIQGTYTYNTGELPLCMAANEEYFYCYVGDVLYQYSIQGEELASREVKWAYEEFEFDDTYLLYATENNLYFASDKVIKIFSAKDIMQDGSLDFTADDFKGHLRTYDDFYANEYYIMFSDGLYFVFNYCPEYEDPANQMEGVKYYPFTSCIQNKPYLQLVLGYEYNCVNIMIGSKKDGNTVITQKMSDGLIGLYGDSVYQLDGELYIADPENKVTCIGEPNTQFLYNEQAGCPYYGSCFSDDNFIILGTCYGKNIVEKRNYGTIGEHDGDNLRYVDIKTKTLSREFKTRKYHQIVYADSKQYIEFYGHKLIFHSAEDGSKVRTEKLKKVTYGQDYNIELCGDELYFYCGDEMIEKVKVK